MAKMIVGGSHKRALKRAAKASGFPVERFVHIPFEQVRRMPPGSVEAGFLSKTGEFYGVLAKEGIH